LQLGIIARFEHRGKAVELRLLALEIGDEAAELRAAACSSFTRPRAIMPVLVSWSIARAVKAVSTGPAGRSAIRSGCRPEARPSRNPIPSGRR
jgi:hypothetical protein